MAVCYLSDMTTLEIAQKLVDLCREGKAEEAISSLYSSDIVSVEAMPAPGSSREVQGIEAVAAKALGWIANHDVHSANVEGPLVAGPHFTVRFTYDITNKPSGRRMMMDELAMYHVKDGKIDREEFFYAT